MFELCYAKPQRAPLLRAALLASLLLGIATEGNAQPTLTINQALELAFAHNPTIRESDHQIAAALAASRQAAALPNPEIEVEVEDFGGSGELRGFESAETTLRLTQLLELGGKRRGRRALAQSQERLAAWDGRAARFDLRLRVKLDYLALLAAQRRQALARESLALADDFLRVAKARTAAGRVSELESARAQVEREAALIAEAQAVRAVALAERVLAANWGAEQWEFGALAGDLEAAPAATLPSADLPAVETNPDLARWSDVLQLAEQERALIEAERTPDLTLSLGIGHRAAEDSHVFVAALALPLPLFDRRSAAIAAARHESEALKARHEAALLAQRAALAAALANVESAHAAMQSLREHLLPASRRAFESAQSGYREGKLELLQVLDARRALQEAAGELLEASLLYHTSAAELERLTATPFETIK